MEDKNYTIEYKTISLTTNNKGIGIFNINFLNQPSMIIIKGITLFNTNNAIVWLKASSSFFSDDIICFNSKQINVFELKKTIDNNSISNYYNVYIQDPDTPAPVNNALMIMYVEIYYIK